MNEQQNIRFSCIVGFVVLVFASISLFFLALSVGQVDIPLKEIVSAFYDYESTTQVNRTIIMEARLPMAVTAVLAGASLSISGLLLQTVFHNPLAGPSLLGVSSGASLGVALLMMGGFTGIATTNSEVSAWLYLMFGAIAGAMVVISILVSFSTLLRNGLMLLIIGIMVSYLSSSVISLLSYYSFSDSLKSFTVWGLGSYAGVTIRQIPIFSLSILLLCIASFGCIKPLNAFLLGERYACSLGFNIKRTRSLILLLSGLLTAVVTAYCGPIGFIGLIVPHIVRMLFRTSNHVVVLPASILTGASVSLFCLILSNGLIGDTMLPINVVTPLVGVPIICYIILRRNRLPYFK